MKLLHLPALLCLWARLSSASLSYTVTGTLSGVPLDPSEIILEERPRNGGLPNKSSRSISSRRRDTIVNSTNWCGVSQATTSANQFKSAYGVFQVPTISSRAGDTNTANVGIWVGIDGIGGTVDASILQSGIGAVFQGSTASYNAWWEWYPAPSVRITSMPVNPGDFIAVTVNVTSSTSGTMQVSFDLKLSAYWFRYESISTVAVADYLVLSTMSNLSTANTYIITLTNGYPLQGLNADWILEDTTGDDFPDFTTFWFEECAAIESNGATVGINGATDWSIYLTSQECTPTIYDNSDFYVSDD